MNIEEIRAIVKLMSEHELTEFKVSAEEYNLCIRRKENTQGVAMPMAQPIMQMQPQAIATSVEAPAAVVAPDAAMNTIDAPIVGTFYTAPSPEAPTFVKVGDTVTPDTVIGIIEAMKVMNEIKAEKSGVVKQILVDNAQPVEYGQALLAIE